jgi:hypothetical protein
MPDPVVDVPPVTPVASTAAGQSSSHSRGPALELTIRPRTVLIGMVIASLVFTVVSITESWWVPVLDPKGILQLRRLFNVNLEQNIPTWFQGTGLFFCSILLGLIGFTTRQLRRRDSAYWLALAAIFTYLSIDEFASIHETVGDALGDKLVGAVTYAWTAPAALIVAIFGLLYLRFLWRMPRRNALLMILSGAIYVGGALGVEFIQAVIIRDAGKRQEILPLMKHVEELGEMLGISCFTYTLFFIASAGRAARFRLERLTSRD